MSTSGNPLQQYGSGAFGAEPIESLQLGYYLNLLTSEYRNSPKLNKFLYALLKKFDDISICQTQLDSAFDVDVAVGVQLDAVGAIVGASRNLPFQPTGGLSPTLDDSDYRIYVKAKAAQDCWNGKIDSLQTIWEILFPTGQIIIADNQNMTATIIIEGTFSPIMLQMIANGLIVPRPQGVQYIYAINPILPIFGADYNNAFVAGADIGHAI
jgi:hypothetical protein